MATHRLGRSQEARTHFEEGRAAVGEKFEGGLNRGTGIQGFWFDWIFARILLREAGDMLGVSVDPATTGD
jgi:hypothetical protein